MRARMPVGAITAGPKLMFNGYEIWKSDSQKCATYRITTEGGAMCGLCMKTCPWNLEGLFAEKPFRWAAMNVPAAAPVLAKLDDAQMIRWSQVLIDGAGNFGWDPALFEKTDAANAEMDAHFAAMIPRHKADPNPSVLCAMVTAADPIEPSQIRSNLKIAIGGGLNEPRDALVNILYGVLSDPDQTATVKQSGAWGDAFDEGVRWIAPIQVSSRLVLQETQLRGVTIPKGETVMTIQASANRDEEIWENGEVFDMTRAKQPHQAFGNGPHFCQGKHIARRMLADILLPRLFDRFPNIALHDPAQVRFEGFAFRGALNLPVTLG